MTSHFEAEPGFHYERLLFRYKINFFYPYYLLK
jgi:hypothetical protein